jgi:tetratricopeptide (TPR) repeat protein
MIMRHATIENVLAASAEAKITLLVGAGCSASAGIPLASEIADEIRTDLAKKGVNLPDSAGYAECMNELVTRQRHLYVKRICENGEDFLDKARKKIAKAQGVDTLTPPSGGPARIVASTKSARRRKRKRSLSPSALIVAGKYEEIVERYEALKDDAKKAEPWREAATSALIELGNKFGHLVLDSPNPAQAETTVSQAIRKYQQALEVSPNSAWARNAWGVALLRLSTHKDKTEAISLLIQAIEKFDDALKIDTSYGAVANNWLVALERLKHYSDAHSLSPGSGAYNAACAAALLGNSEEARRWLEISKQHGTLSPKVHLERDTDLDAIRGETWFKAYMDDA